VQAQQLSILCPGTEFRHTCAVGCHVCSGWPLALIPFLTGGPSAACHSTLIDSSLLNFCPLCHSSNLMSAGPNATLIMYSIRWYFCLEFHQCLFFNLKLARGRLEKSEVISQSLRQAEIGLVSIVNPQG
jgi:hypothetical protein